MNRVLKATVREGGLISFPEDLLAAAGVSARYELVVEVIDGQIRARRDPIAHARALFRQAVGPEYTVDDFIAERRVEARQEARDYGLPDE